MAKEKKRGFFSWLGFGKEEETQQPAETPEQQPEDPALAQAETDAAHTVELTEQLAEAQREAPAHAVDEHIAAEPEAEPIVQKAQDAEIIAPLEEIIPEEEPELAPQPIEEEIVPEALPEEEQPLDDEELAALALAEAPQDEAAEEIAAEDEIQDTVSDLPLAAAPIVSQEQERPTKEGFFARLKRSLVKTRQNLGSGFISLFRGKKIDDDLFEELEEQLLIADVGVETTRRIITNLTQQANRKQLRDAEALYGLLKAEMSGILAKVDAPLDVSGKAPFVILMVGVNGVGKTTTIGKLARQYQAQGKSVMLAAGDTFRAAAVEQLQVWGERNHIPVVAQHTGADSASVIFDAIQAAKARGVDVLIADTAGRLQNKSHLMEELKKITRVMKKLDEEAPHEVMLTLDASTGQNAISQAKLFHEAVGLTGITLTKLDGTAKGGVIFSVADQFGIPIRYIGVGEGIEDLRPFKAEDFIEALFARED
ncbi:MULTISPECIES: signal recognition particle-docking protein FtsY [Pantoea]|jgi:fused signal recognition particle receptor|uniref:signal recognition particle-docking protein FtsY n=1 Tax=Pantoea TaxID=53335 RepID=UPI000EA0F128|nr:MULTISPECIES: signal recognition particle-docking protein FtsY [Pantoea]MBZ6388671.1 signal recognition particle-docking protein FtsY [Pantoea piersonii]MBZ6402007.1 signal recognition particle-docking protein FtsY [Pantoea piersonii]MBZ6410656.1 signal recognition particle-docking protein FtsY [Pantoea piersonii]MBZ6429267.1 signal recognition particle-docking protein FtsY [Pantoea piersonii]NYB03446.1 signal recognition particle-docking protein FtsY [Pantoea piersonii]